MMPILIDSFGFRTIYKPYIRPLAVRPPTIPGRADPLGLLLFTGVQP
jgi:hypothetical protein